MSEPEHYGDFRLLPVERVRELERSENLLEQVVGVGNMQLRELRQQVVELQQALAWYSDRANWRPRGLDPKVPADEDRGRRARRALGLPL